MDIRRDAQTFAKILTLPDCRHVTPQFPLSFHLTIMLNVRTDSLSSDRDIAVKGGFFCNLYPGFISISQTVASAPSDASNVTGVSRVVENAPSEDSSVLGTIIFSSNGLTADHPEDQNPKP